MNVLNKYFWIAVISALLVWNVEKADVFAFVRPQSEISIRDDKTVMTDLGELSLSKLENALVSLKRLYINHSILSDEIAQLVADKIADGAMQYLYISRADISSTGMKMIINALNSKTCKLADLTVFGDRFHESCGKLLMEDMEAEMLIPVLRENTSLQNLLIGTAGISQSWQNMLREACNKKGVKFLYFER